MIAKHGCAPAGRDDRRQRGRYSGHRGLPPKTGGRSSGCCVETDGREPRQGCGRAYRFRRAGQEPDVHRRIDRHAQELARHHTDDGKGAAVYDDRSREDVFGASETGAPEPVADHGCGLPVSLDLSPRGPSTQYIEEVPGRGRHDPFGLADAINRHERTIQHHVGAHASEDSQRAQGLHRGPVDRVGLSGAAIDSLHRHEPIRIDDRQLPQEQRVHQAEERHGRSQAECERHHGHGDESRCRANSADGKPDVPPHRVQELERASQVDLLKLRARAAELRPGQPPRLGGIDAPVNEFLGVQFKMRIHLGGPLAELSLAFTRIEPAHLCFPPGRTHDAPDSASECDPAIRFVGQLTTAAWREAVEARAAPCLREPPGGSNPAALFEAMERGIQRSLLD